MTEPEAIAVLEALGWRRKKHGLFPPIVHGKASTYTNHGCRCRPCKDAFAARHREYMRRHPEQREKAHVRESVRYHGLSRSRKVVRKEAA